MISKVTRTHYKELWRWHDLQNIPRPSREDFSTMGYIADNRVAGFLHLMNSNTAMVSGIVCNPESVPSLRAASLLKLQGFLVDTAVSLGYNNVIVLSTDEYVEKTSIALGFENMKDSKIMKLRYTL